MKLRHQDVYPTFLSLQMVPSACLYGVNMTLSRIQVRRATEKNCIIHSLVWIQQTSPLDRCQLPQREDGLYLLSPTPVVRQNSTLCMILHSHTRVIPPITSTSIMKRRPLFPILLLLGHSILTRSLSFLARPDSLVRGPSMRRCRRLLSLVIHVFHPSESHSMPLHRSSGPQDSHSVRHLGCLN